MLVSDKKFIDESSYETLLRRWRYSYISDSIFIGESGSYCSKVMAEKREALKEGVAVRISKSMGWSIY